nr:MAG TPA: hypothetical protein [Caudoviricetes sp.]
MPSLILISACWLSRFHLQSTNSFLLQKYNNK